MRAFLQRYWVLLLAAFIFAAWQFPIVWCIVNAEAGIGALLVLGHTQFQAFLYGCIAGNVECLIWNWLIGRKIDQKRKEITEKIKSGREEVRAAGLTDSFRDVWKFFLDLFEPEQYVRHWMYRAVMRIRKYAVLGFFANVVLLGFIAICCVIPGVIFAALTLVRLTRLRFGLVAILLGNTGKMAFAAYGFWPIVLSAIKSIWSYL
ncbi:MAG: hypothetical protein Q7S09_05380 [bacterium]|nr:hypothetical protein [bacterium]